MKGITTPSCSRVTSTQATSSRLTSRLRLAKVPSIRLGVRVDRDATRERRRRSCPRPCRSRSCSIKALTTRRHLDMASSRQDARSPPPGPSLSRFASSSSLASSVPGSPSVSGGGSPNMSMRRIPSSGWGKVGTSGDPALSKRRAKNLLRDYYGLSAQGGDAAGTGAGAGDGAVKGKGKDRGDYRDDDFDSPHFDAQRFFDNFVSKATLPQLLDQANTLMGEVRELDGERQSLVYNHHHELVEASGTIGKVCQPSLGLTPMLTTTNTRR